MLMTLWWGLPAFGVLVLGLGYERACRDAYALLPELTSRVGYAWPLAGLYLGGHCWVVAVYTVTASRTGTLLPSVSRWRRGVAATAS